MTRLITHYQHRGTSNNPYNQVWVNPRLANEWDVTFTPPFSGLPAIALSNFGDDAFSSGGSMKTVGLNYSKSNLAGTNFTVVVGYNINNNGGSYNGGSLCWPYGDGFEFIAIGPK